MNKEDRDNEDIDMNEEYEMIPLEPMMYGYGQMNMMPSMGMNPSMGMQPNMGMNPWMEMNQFNGGMFMNGFNPMGMMYGDTPMNEYEDEENEESRQLDNYQDREAYNRPIRPNPQYNDADSIVRRIEKYNPAIFWRLTRCGLPYVEAREMVRRIVRLTLMYREE